MTRYPFLLACSLFVLSACQKGGGEAAITKKPLFDSIPTVVPVVPLISEASGVADSKLNAGYLWVEEDSGNPPELTLLKHNGAVQKKIYLKGITNRDWEDIILAGNDLYLGETGDNNLTYPDYAFYKFSEPALAIDTVINIETIRFKYPDGSHDAEAFLVDPQTGAIYIVTKRDNPSRIYKLVPLLSLSSINTAVLVGQLNYSGVVSAALSSDRKELILKTYFGLNYYTVSAAETIEAALQKPSLAIPYQVEPQGEAVCFSATNNGYFTLSEKGPANNVQLFFYKRN